MKRNTRRLEMRPDLATLCTTPFLKGTRHILTHCLFVRISYLIIIHLQICGEYNKFLKKKIGACLKLLGFCHDVDDIYTFILFERHPIYGKWSILKVLIVGSENPRRFLKKRKISKIERSNIGKIYRFVMK